MVGDIVSIMRFELVKFSSVNMVDVVLSSLYAVMLNLTPFTFSNDEFMI